jgi:hypothetical protein
MTINLEWLAILALGVVLMVLYARLNRLAVQTTNLIKVSQALVDLVELAVVEAEEQADAQEG